MGMLRIHSTFGVLCESLTTPYNLTHAQCVLWQWRVRLP